MKVSVIVPVYNGEKTLTACLGNLMYQTLEDMKLILVNDASTDGSLRIMQDCQKLSSKKVKIIDSKNNKGPGGARNLGIQKAEGQYIGFVDCDDVVDLMMYEKLYKKAVEDNYDIVDCGFINEKTKQAIIYTSDDLTGELNSEKRSKLIASGGYLWSKIFRRVCLQNVERCTFREKAILEDADVLTYLYATVKSIGNVKEVLYKYVYNCENISESNTSNPEKYHKNIVAAIKAIYDKVSDLENYAEIQKAVEYEMIQMYLYGIINCLKNRGQEGFHADIGLEELQNLKQQIISIEYKQNPYVMNKIKGEDFMLLNKF